MPAWIPLLVIAAAPVAALAIVLFWIFQKFEDGIILRGEPVGAGAGETAGANAIGQWLAGRNPDAITARERLLREGDHVAPEALPGGIDLRVLATEPALPPGGTLVLVIDHEGERSALPFSLDPDGGWKARLGPGLLPLGASVRIESGDRTLIAATDDGGPARFRPLPPVPNQEAANLEGEPLGLVIDAVRLVARPD